MYLQESVYVHAFQLMGAINLVFQFLTGVVATYYAYFYVLIFIAFFLFFRESIQERPT